MKRSKLVKSASQAGILAVGKCQEEDLFILIFIWLSWASFQHVGSFPDQGLNPGPLSWDL